MDKVTFPDFETTYLPTGKDNLPELYAKYNDRWHKVTGMTTGPAVQYFIDFKKRNIICDECAKRMEEK